MKPTGQTKPNAEWNGNQRALNAVGYTLAFALVCLAFGTCVSGCTVIEKLRHKHVEKVDSTVIHRTDSLAYHQKTVKEGHQLSVRFDTGCTNTFTINPTTGIIQASGGVTGVVFTGTKEGKEVDSVRLQGETKTVLQKEETVIHKQTTKTVIPWWVYAVLGLGLVYAAYRVYKQLNPLSKFYPF